MVFGNELGLGWKSTPNVAKKNKCSGLIIGTAVVNPRGPTQRAVDELLANPTPVVEPVRSLVRQAIELFTNIYTQIARALSLAIKSITISLSTFNCRSLLVIQRAIVTTRSRSSLIIAVRILHALGLKSRAVYSSDRSINREESQYRDDDPSGRARCRLQTRAI